MVGGTSHRNRIIEIFVLGQIVVLFENVFLDGASRGGTQQLSSISGFAICRYLQSYICMCAHIFDSICRLLHTKLCLSFYAYIILCIYIYIYI